jgi:hypothetical protein
VFVYALVFIHYPTAIVLCFPSAVLHFIDVISRKFSSRKAEIVSSFHDAEAMITRIDIFVPSFKGKVKMAQFLVMIIFLFFVFFLFLNLNCLYLKVLRIPELESAFIEQRHPFSIAHFDENKSVVSVFARNMGNGCFTSLLATQANSLTRMTVQIEGPYGALQLDPSKAQTIVKRKLVSPLFCVLKKRNTKLQILLSAGVGVTPMVSMLSSLASSAPNAVGKILFVWAFRGRKVFRMFQSLIAAAVAKSNVPIELQLYDSNAASIHPLMQEPASVNGGESEPLLAQQQQHEEEIEFEINMGRPNLETLIQAAKHGKTFLYVCGPAPFVATVNTIAVDNSLPVHEETFLF